MNAQQLLQEISDYCRQTGLAESTFGRRAVNDGKLAARLRNGGRITTDTLDRIHGFMASHPAHDRPTIIERPREPRAMLAAGSAPATGAAPTPPAGAAGKPGDPQRNFRFFDNRQKYLLFVNTCSEKWEVAQPRVRRTRPHPSAAAGGARVRRRRRRRLGAGAGDARDARPLPAHAVLHRRQGNQPRRHPPDLAEDGRPLLRASVDGSGADQSRLRGRAVAARQVAQRGVEPGLARAAADRQFGAPLRAADHRSRTVPGAKLEGRRLARGPAIRSTSVRSCS